jgi:polysaccharide export outer membrane protein
MHKSLFKVLAVNISIITIVFLSSCGSTKHLRFFQDVPDSTRSVNLKLTAFSPQTIHPQDVLAITILTIDPTAPVTVNQANTASTLNGTSTNSSTPEQTGYIVDKDGNIEMPEIGKVKVDGLTVDEAKTLVTQRASVYFKDPIVFIKRSLKITVMGEVNRGGIVIAPNEKFSVIDALNQAGGLTDYGKRDNILLLRQNENNTVSTFRLNLKSADIFKSQYFFLQNNDILYIEPSKNKGITSDQVFNRGLTLGTLGLSLITTFFYFFRK